MSGVELRELRYFVAVAEELHFGRAAERLGIAQPPLSQAVRRLEARLGVRLLERSTRRVALTRAGGVLLDQARVALEAADAAVARTVRAGARPGGLVVTSKGDAALLTAITDAYRARGGSVEVVVSGWGEQTRMLLGGTADAALVHLPFPRRGLDFQPLVEEPRVAVLPSGHRLAGCEVLRLADLSGEPFPYWSGSDAASAAYWSGRDRPAGPGGPLPPAPPGPPVDDSAQLLEVVALGQAVALLPESDVAGYARPDVVSRPVADASPSVVGLAWPEASRSRELAAFVAAACAVVEGEPVAAPPG
ncbi:LysR family transcriptional regulator [Allonocardiopsis opalescens]|uniref:LysR family transcriptional regulator n=1 Tax=Allonocardiopsis opalescens TaxID=1144618 RepID=A0A2T0PW88_9ACTN|nr:LysR substrate-binding domain-containing protein [Allonocardiopsis opalescens]PRX95777.1 LysR family transcriptional regulator [Allonocardiopsis opalescens]